MTQNSDNRIVLHREPLLVMNQQTHIMQSSDEEEEVMDLSMLDNPNKHNHNQHRRGLPSGGLRPRKQAVRPPPRQQRRGQDPVTHEPRSILPTPTPTPPLSDHDGNNDEDIDLGSLSNALPLPPAPPLIVAEPNHSIQASPVEPVKSQLMRPLPPIAPPARSKNKTYNDYASYLRIISKLETKVGPQTAASFAWQEEEKGSMDGGIICKYCDEKADFNGYFTSSKPVRNYNAYKLVSHTKSVRHQRSVPPSHLLEIRKLLKNERASISTVDISSFKCFFHKFHLLLYYAQCNYPLKRINKLINFIQVIGGEMDSSQYPNEQTHREIIISLAEVQEQQDFDLVRSMADNHGLFISMDGQKRFGANLKVFAARGVPVGSFAPRQIFLDLVRTNKGISRDYHIEHRLTINSAEDQLLVLDDLMNKIARPYSVLLGICSDGEASTMGAKNGLIALLQKHRNAQIEAFYVLCHRANLMICQPYKKSADLKGHITNIQNISSLFSDSVPQQILVYTQEMDQVKRGGIAKPVDWRFVFMVEPMRSIDANYNQVLKGLHYMKDNRHTDDQKERARTTYAYWGDLEHLVLNNVCTAFAMEADILIHNLSKCSLDRLSGFVYLHNYMHTIEIYKKHGIATNNEYIQKCLQRFKYKQTMKHGQTVMVVRYGEFKWTLRENARNLDNASNQKAIKMADDIIAAYKQRFDEYERVTLKHLISAIDPRSYKRFKDVKSIKDFGNKAVRECIKYMHTVQNASKQNMYNFDTELVLCQFEISKLELFKLRDIKEPEKRLPEYFMFLLSKPHLFSNLIGFLKRHIIANGTNVELERIFSQRVWIQGRQRGGMEADLITALMRIIKNAPKAESEDARAFIVEAMLKWYGAKDRMIKSKLLEDLKASMNTVNKKEAIDAFIEQVWN